MKDEKFKKVQEQVIGLVDPLRENISDGYHSFKELYDFRKQYNAALFNMMADNPIYHVHKSKKHHDGEVCFDGFWFIVVAILPGGKQISNHYDLKDWDLFNIPETETALFPFDNHSSKDVLDRLEEFNKKELVVTDDDLDFYQGKHILLKRKEIQHIEFVGANRNQIIIIFKSTRYDFEQDCWENAGYISPEEKDDFLKWFCK